MTQMGHDFDPVSKTVGILFDSTLINFVKQAWSHIYMQGRH